MGFIYLFIFVIIKRIIKEEYHELRKNRPQKAERPDFPHLDAWKKAHVSLIRAAFISLIALCICVICLGFGSYKGVIDNTPDVDDIDISRWAMQHSSMTARATRSANLPPPSSNCLPVSIDQIPLDLQHAVVAIEDERFYEHNGIDVRGILRAASRVLTTGSPSEGASTITQQLLKNNVFTNWIQSPPGWNGLPVNSRSSIWPFRWKKRSMTRT